MILVCYVSAARNFREISVHRELSETIEAILTQKVSLSQKTDLLGQLAVAAHSPMAKAQTQYYISKLTQARHRIISRCICITVLTAYALLMIDSILYYYFPQMPFWVPSYNTDFIFELLMAFFIALPSLMLTYYVIKHFFNKKK